MPTNKSNRGAAASAPKQAKKKSLPPQPAMFRLHSPVEAAPVPSDAVAKEDEGKKTPLEAEGGGEKPAVTSTDGPSVTPATKSNKEPAADDVASMDQKLPAKEPAMKGTAKEDKHESDKDSITGEINKKSSSPKRHPDKSSNDPLPQNSAKNAKNDSYFLDSDSDDNDDKPKFSFPKAAIKRPRNSASAEAYAKRMREKEEEKKKENGEAEGGGQLLDDGRGGNKGMDEKPAAKKSAATKGKGGKSPAKAGEKEGSVSKKGHVKTKHTPKVPDDLPPRKLASRRKSAVKAAKSESPKSPPVEIQPTRTRSKRASGSSAGLKSPPEEVKEVSTKRKSRSKKSLPASELEVEESPRKRRASKTPAKAPEKSSGSSAGLKSPPDEVKKVSAKRKSRSKKSLPESEEVEVSPRKPRASKTPAKAPAKSPGSSAGPKSTPGEVEEVSAKRKSRSKSLPESEQEVEESPRKPRASKTPAKAPAKSSTPSGSRRSKRKTSEVAEELVSTLEVAEPREEEEATTSRRSKRARKPSLGATEAKNNIAASVALAAISSTKPAARPSPSKRKAPKAREVPIIKIAKITVANKTGRAVEYLEAKKTNTWMKRIAMLKAHKELYDTCDLTFAPRDSVPPLLQSFVMESRKQYKKFQRGEHSALTAARIGELESLGFDFAPMKTGSTRGNHDRRFQLQWDEQFFAIQKYKAEHGDCLVSCMGTGEHAKLGNWVRGQRKLLNKVGREGFNPERLAKLEEIGFDFDPMRSGAFIAKKRANMFPRVDANWERHYQSLVKYKKEHGNIIVGPNTEGWPGLYDWIHCQRKEYKKWEADDEKALMYEKWIKQLNDLGFDWAPMKSDGFSKMLLQRQSKHFNDLWMLHYGDLKKFHKKHGHCYASRVGDEEVLASWVHVQRKHKKKHDEGKKTPLTAERIKLLNDIGIDWAPSKTGGMQKVTQVRRDEDWEGVFAKLVSFKKKSGHANPKKVEPQLGPWACRMRKLYSQHKNGATTTLSEVKIAKLESIGFRFGRLRGSED